MLRNMTENLSRQAQALSLLAQLLEEEFSHLRALDPKAVMGIEFSIQELMRQIAQERLDFKSMFGEIAPGLRLVEAVGGFVEPYCTRIRELMLRINQAETACSERASRNYKMALGLFDQSQGYVNFLQQQIIPKAEVYSARGRYGKTPSSQGALLSGRL